jgi:CheY-like chemotaxis protein
MTSDERRSAGLAPSILVVDDDLHVKKFFASVLTKAGYSVHEASNGVEAKAALQNNVFDLMILDLNMPEVDGFEVLQFARAKIPNLKIIVASGFMQGIMLQAAKQFGAVAALDKPVEIGLLLSTVRKAMESAE